MDLRGEVAEAIRRGADYLFSNQLPNSCWYSDLQISPSSLSDYVTLCRVLNVDLRSKKDSIIQYYSERQNPNGSWSSALESQDGTISSTAEVFLSLRILGLSSGSPSLSKAGNYISKQGGLSSSSVHILTRIKCALFGLVSWNAVPTIPAELVLLPSQLPLLLDTSSTWRRSVWIPLLVIYHHRPVFPLPDEVVLNAPKSMGSLKSWGIDDPPRRLPSLDVLMKHGLCFKSFFLVARDFLFRIYENHKVEFLREHARKKCIDWILEHGEDVEDLKSSDAVSSMLYTTLAMTLESDGVDSSHVHKTIQALHACRWPWDEDSSGCKIRPSVLSVWDTALASFSLLECGWDPDDGRVNRALRWLLDRRLQFKDGDWKARRPQSTSEGCSERYPDVDITAAVLLCLFKHESFAAIGSVPIERAVRWCTRVQNSDGGWAASHAENGCLFHNETHSESGRSTPDVTGHVLEALGFYLRSEVSKNHSKSLRKRAYYACQRGIINLRLSQDAQGLWFGRGDAHCIYGTMNALCGLASLGVRGPEFVVSRALGCLRRSQNGDGGWGEHGKSTPSQTAWALLGLLNYLPAEDSTIEHGIRWLLDSQTQAGRRYSDCGSLDFAVPISGTCRRSTWNECHLYMYSHLCRHYYPMIVLGRFMQL
ncbi:protein MpCQC [Marchantia polymorpha subsp. ruderalis]|uniref:Terpene cyclase/mutase family member n=1 Tax=Marchantia polymorpha TaxID=3197 RepID=A0A2R6WV83_MARPO|nr:hypothetical protein MARPO_0055s0038 [Marchantia polymorpha]BBN03029.1 hypothetical protein Mp_2g20110 [Marchantia polymorpha subsp. ruderalis]|eukprot:PTQ37759.1 hypothetical protein MARPO_0055s0038 [Marchantia polymorpha]